MKLSLIFCIDAQGYSTKSTSSLDLPRPFYGPRITIDLFYYLTLLTALLTVPPLTLTVGTVLVLVVVDY